jgi:hypothetical protein
MVLVGGGRFTGPNYGSIRNDPERVKHQKKEFIEKIVVVLFHKRERNPSGTEANTKA